MGQAEPEGVQAEPRAGDPVATVPDDRMDEIHEIHDFRGKLKQASVFPQIVDYVR